MITMLLGQIILENNKELQQKLLLQLYKEYNK